MPKHAHQHSHTTKVWRVRPHQVVAPEHPGVRLREHARHAGGGGGGAGRERDAGDADGAEDPGGRHGGCVGLWLVAISVAKIWTLSIHLFFG
jgi:hypothetical protein